jgi:hypothetical protein
MNETDLRRYLSMMGIQVEGRNPKKGKVWLNLKCPLATRHWKHQYRADSNPSAGAVADTTGHFSRWACAACKSHGTIAGLARDLGREDLADQIDATEALGLAAVSFGQDLQVEDPLGEPLIEEMYEGLYAPAWLVPETRHYLEGRGISEATTEALGLTYNARARRIMFPVRDRQGGLHGWSQRDITGQQQPKILDADLPKRHLILGSHLWLPDRPLIIVEGLFAYARMVELGVLAFANVGALLGSVVTAEKAELIRVQDSPTYLLLDNDLAGDVGIFGTLREDGSREAGTGAVALLKDYVPIFIPAYPEGKDDPDQLTLWDIQDMLEITLRHGYEINS